MSLERSIPTFKLSLKLSHLHPVLRFRMCGALPPPQCIFMAWCLVNHRDNFTFTFTKIFSINMPMLSEQVYFWRLENKCVIIPITDEWIHVASEIQRRGILQKGIVYD